MKRRNAGPIDEASVREWMDFMRKHQLSHCNRAISDKRESASVLRPGASEKGGWSDAELTASGLLVRGLIRSWGR